MQNNGIFMENLNSNDESQNNIPYYIMRCSNNSRCDHVYLYII